jgi:hypothetical protein
MRFTPDGSTPLYSWFAWGSGAATTPRRLYETSTTIDESEAEPTG